MPTNIYNVPAKLWSSMTATEQALFNHRFAGGIQVADVRYHPTFNSHISYDSKPRTAIHSRSGVLPWTQSTAYAAGDYVSYEWQDYICVTPHIGSVVPGFMDWTVTENFFKMSIAYAPYAASMFNSTIVIPRAPGKPYALKDLVSFQPTTPYAVWAPTTPYTAGALVQESGILYVCVVTHMSWLVFDQAELINFLVDTRVRDGVCTTAHTSTWVIVPGNFAPCNYRYRGPFTLYTAGDYVKYNGQAYICVTTATSGLTFSTTQFRASEYTPRTALTGYLVGDLISYNGQDYIVTLPFISTSTFDATNLSAENADLTINDFKNIKTFFESVEIQQPIPGIVTGPVGFEINQSVRVAKKFFDKTYEDLIKQTIHTVKYHSPTFNI